MDFAAQLAKSLHGTDLDYLRNNLQDTRKQGWFEHRGRISSMPEEKGAKGTVKQLKDQKMSLGRTEML